MTCINPNIQQLYAQYIYILFIQSELQPWDSWDADENKQKYSANGRRFPHVNQRQTSQEEEPEPDYFEDMTPKIKKQKKVFINMMITHA